jgi:hypothetical protein
MAKAAYKRRVYLINKDFQVKFIVFTMVIAVIIICAFYGMVHYFFRASVNLGVEAGFPPGHVYFRFVQDSRSDMNVFFLITAVVVFILITVAGTIFSHKIAGPIYRLTNYLLSVSAEKLIEPVKFRTNDFFLEVAEAYNRRVEFLRNMATNTPSKLIDALKHKDNK